MTVAAPAARRARTPRRWGFLVRRLGFYLAAAWSAITLNFFLPRLMPGNPSSAIVEKLQRVSGQQLSASAAESIHKVFGNPDANLGRQYIDYLGQLAHFDLGISVSNFPVPVSDLLWQGLPWTLLLVGATTVIAFVLGTGIGAVAGWKAGSRFDAVVSPLTTFVSAIPYFWMALIALWLFGFQLGWFPLSGGYDADIPISFSPSFLLSVLHYGVLPATTIVFSAFGGWLLGMRNMTVTTVREDYVLLAQAKGLSNRRVMLRYAARNAVLPNFTGFALALGHVVGGALLTEVVFNYPGVGYLLFTSLQQRDYPVMQGVFFLIMLTVLLANLLADSVYALLDPRIREGG
ncbi:ABC transporter permease [Streptomyces sp. NPDC005970]|uniref:ABC transporter permease n=1 Tax=Streptomyces sp. NPDC005970 TaxID=3156723 RepID=UPI0034085CF0